MNEPSASPDWSQSDERTAEMVARLIGEEDPISAGLGLGMSDKTIENMGGDGGGFSSGALTFSLDVIEGGEFVHYTGVPADGRSLA